MSSPAIRTPETVSVAGEATLFGEPFVEAEVALYSLPDLIPVAASTRTDRTGSFRVVWSASPTPFVLTLIEKEGVQLSGIVSSASFRTQGIASAALSLASTVATRSLLSRYVQLLVSRSASPESSLRISRLAERLSEVEDAVSAVMTEPILDVQLQSSLLALRHMPTLQLIRQVTDRSLRQAFARQASLRWLESCHEAIIDNIREGGAAFRLSRMEIGQMPVETPQITLAATGRAAVQFRGASVQFDIPPGALTRDSDMDDRLVHIDELLGNPIPRLAHSGGGSPPAPPTADVTVQDGNVPAPVWEEP